MKSNVLEYCLENKEFDIKLKKLINLNKAYYFNTEVISLLKENMNYYDYFEKGLNEGNCGITCMLLSLLFNNCYIVSGTNKYLKGKTHQKVNILG